MNLKRLHDESTENFGYEEQGYRRGLREALSLLEVGYRAPVNGVFNRRGNGNIIAYIEGDVKGPGKINKTG